jgi:2-iminobutanoate/2-iminopropanoate deaminase
MKLFGVVFASMAVMFPHLCFCDIIQKIDTPQAPKPYGAYSQALSVDVEGIKSFVFVSGQVPFDPKSGKMVADDIRSATNQTLDNIAAILKAAGSDWKYVVTL